MTKKVSKIVFLLIGCVFPIFIGSLHTVTHFNDLVTPEIQVYLQKEFLILNKPQPLWYTWGIVSFMMGISFIVLGLTNGSTIKNLSKEKRLPLIPVIAILLFQICVTYVGYEYDQSFQFYGGIFGGILALICLSATLAQNKS